MLREILGGKGADSKGKSGEESVFPPGVPSTYLWICWMQGRTKTRPPATMTGGLLQNPVR